MDSPDENHKFGIFFHTVFRTEVSQFSLVIINDIVIILVTV